MDQGLDKSIIREFAKLRVLANCGISMDELVQDLASALEESSGAAHQKIRHWRRRERRRSAMKLGLQLPGPSTSTEGILIPSEDSASSVDDHKPLSNCGFGLCANHTDSDGASSGGGKNSQLVYIQNSRKFAVGSFVESDSVNENFSPVRPHRRKRKFKRMAVDPSSSSEACANLISLPTQTYADGQKEKLCIWLKQHANCSENVCCETDGNVEMSPTCSGKRKHSMRERSVEIVEGERTSVFRQPNCMSVVNCKGGPSQMSSQQLINFPFEKMEENMYNLIESSSSLSSSESDAGIYTNDEGREGDDEQSDFYHESGPVCGVPGVKAWWQSQRLDVDKDENQDALTDTFKSIFTGNFQHLSDEAKQAYKDSISKIQSVSGRKIRAGRRRLRDSRPGFSIVSSMNEKISKFLQDPEQNELKLYHMRKTEIDQLSNLASLYSLNIHTEGTKKNLCPVLTKTRNTTQTTNLEKISGISNVWHWPFSSDIKRRRRTPPLHPGKFNVPVGEVVETIPETDVGNQILKSVGWESGRELGSTTEGINFKAPITATGTVRPKFQSLDFEDSSAIPKPS